MIEGIDIVEWLRNHSVSENINGREIRFEHSTGDVSVVVKSENYKGKLARPQNSNISGFYIDYLGASIGNSDLMITSSAIEGYQLSDGYKIPAIKEACDYAINAGAPIKPDTEVFIVESGWMFLHYFNESINKLVHFDRDYQKVNDSDSFLSVLNKWWELVEDNPN